jgi:hypothetical protein
MHAVEPGVISAVLLHKHFVSPAAQPNLAPSVSMQVRYESSISILNQEVARNNRGGKAKELGREGDIQHMLEAGQRLQRWR